MLIILLYNTVQSVMRRRLSRRCEIFLLYPPHKIINEGQMSWFSCWSNGSGRSKDEFYRWYILQMMLGQNYWSNLIWRLEKWTGCSDLAVIIDITWTCSAFSHWLSFILYNANRNSCHLITDQHTRGLWRSHHNWQYFIQGIIVLFCSHRMFWPQCYWQSIKRRNGKKLFQLQNYQKLFKKYIYSVHFIAWNSSGFLFNLVTIQQSEQLYNGSCLPNSHMIN